MDDGKIMLEEFHLVGNRIEARFALDAAKEIAGCFLALCDEHGAQNYLEMQMHDKSGRGVTVTVRRIEGKTPHQLRQEADAKVIDLTAELEAVRRDAARWQFARERLIRTAPGPDMGGLHHYCPTPDIYYLRGPTLDAAIDAALGQTVALVPVPVKEGKDEGVADCEAGGAAGACRHRSRADHYAGTSR